MSPRFHLAAARDLRPGDVVTLDAAQSRHAHVRRLVAGDAVELFDGRGQSYRGTIDRPDRAATRVRITEVREDGLGESPLDLTLAVAPLKADKLDWVVEKATEIGVTRIVLFASRHCLVEPSTHRLERWQHIAVAAAKQCGRSVVPEMHGPLALHEALRREADIKLLFWEAEEPSRGQLPRVVPRPASVLAVVGPEGGFSAEEVAAARAAEARVVGLGPRILRAETAAIVAASSCQLLWGDLTAARPRA